LHSLKTTGIAHRVVQEDKAVKGMESAIPKQTLPLTIIMAAGKRLHIQGGINHGSTTQSYSYEL